MKVTIQDSRTSVTVEPRDFRVTVSGARGPAGPSEWGGIDGDIEDQTDLYNALQARVPYTGATADVNLGEYGAQLGNLEFDNTPTNVPTAAGSVYWNDTDGTLNMVLKGGQTISRIGETQHIRALNNTGTQIARGKVVYVVGAQGQRLTIALADADTEILSKDTIGFTSEAIADGAEGFVIVQGVINNISTTSMTDGATVYLSQTAGSYTTTPPPDPAHLVILGFIVNGGSGGAGSIYVKVDNGYELEELHNTSDSAKTTPVGADALLLRDSADNNLWKRLTWTNALAGVKTHMDTFKSVAGGYASLDGSGKVPSSELPSYVDDVVEVASFAALPVTGETGKIYVTLDTNKCYRWSGSVYVQVAQGVDTLTTTGTSGAATLVGSTLNIPQYQSVLTNPVTGTGTAGQVSYWSGTGTQTGSASLFWDAANNRLGVGTATPTIALQVERSSNGPEAIWIRNSNTGAGAYGALIAASYGVSPSTTGTVELRSHNFNHAAWPSTGMLVSNSSLTNGLAIFSTAGNITFNTTSAGTERARIESGGNFVIGTTSASARLHVRGSGTTSSTTALLVQNSTPTELFKVLDNGNANFGTGMYWDNANSRLGIGGVAAPSVPLEVKGTTTTDGGQLGSELLTSSNWTTTGWTGDFTNGFSHNTGNTDVLSNTLAAVNGNYYQITWTVTNRTTGTFVLAFGGYTSGNLSVTGSAGPRATTTGNLTITPTTDFNGTIVVSIRVVTVGTATLRLQNSAGTITNEIRSFTATSNTAVGLSAGARITTGGNNSFFGSSAGFSNTTGINNSFFGSSVGATNTTGTNNSFFGWQAGFSNTTGINNSFFGSSVGATNTTGTNNSFFGSSAGLSNTSGVNNSFFGWQAGLSNTSGVNNSFFGQNSGYSNTTGGNNSFFGLIAGFSNTTGINNSFFGSSAGSLIANGSSLTVANNSLFLGFDTRAAANSQTNQIVIGYSAIGLGSNTTVIGNSSTTLTWLGGSTSIGTTTSSGRLTVRGETTTSASNGLLVEDSAGTDTFVIRNDGGYAFKGGTVGLAQTGYTTFTNLVTDRTCDANATTVEELADILGTLIEDLKTKGIIAA